MRVIDRYDGIFIPVSAALPPEDESFLRSERLRGWRLHKEMLHGDFRSLVELLVLEARESNA